MSKTFINSRPKKVVNIWRWERACNVVETGFKSGRVAFQGKKKLRIIAIGLVNHGPVLHWHDNCTSALPKD